MMSMDVDFSVQFPCFSWYPKKQPFFLGWTWRVFLNHFSMYIMSFLNLMMQLITDNFFLMKINVFGYHGYYRFFCSALFCRIVVLVHMGLFGTPSLIEHRGAWVCSGRKKIVEWMDFCFWEKWGYYETGDVFLRLKIYGS